MCVDWQTLQRCPISMYFPLFSHFKLIPNKNKSFSFSFRASHSKYHEWHFSLKTSFSLTLFLSSPFSLLVVAFTMIRMNNKSKEPKKPTMTLNMGQN